MADLLDRTQQQAQAGAKLVLWAEGAAFVLKEDEPALLTRTQALARQEGIYLAMGVLTILRTCAWPAW